jgi:long-chain fatty acid transport protein
MSSANEEHIVMRRFMQMKKSLPLVALPLLLAANQSHGAAFALLEQSGSRLGTAFSGTAAAADDATSVYFNPAGLQHLEGTQFAAALSAVYIKSEFSNQNSQAALGQTLGGEGGNAGGLNWVPSVYASSKLSDRFSIGFGINAPFGLKLEYEPGWIGRFQAMRSEIKTANFNPAIAYRINPSVTIAAGVDYQRLQAELTSAVNYSAVITQALQQRLALGQITQPQFVALVGANAGLQGYTSVEGDDWAWGFNVGVLLDINDAARIGIAYRSPIKYNVQGTVTFSTPATPEPVGTAIVAAVSAAGGPLANGGASVDLKVPGSATISYWQRLTPQVELLADVAWTQWSSIPEIRVMRDTGVVLQTTTEDWRDVWRAAIGAAFTINENWKLRTGIAYDQTPVPDATRTPRLPDTDRYWIAGGASWSPTHAITIDFGYAHLFAKKVPINQNAGNTLQSGLINGEQSTAIDIATVQAGYKF